MSKGHVIGGLGAGIALGTLFGFFALAPNVAGGPGGSGHSVQQQLDQERQARTSAEADAQSADKVVGQVAGDVVSGQLKGKSVVLIALSDANQKDVDRIKDLVAKADGQVSGTLRMTPEFTSAAKADELKSLAATALPAGATLSEDNMKPGNHIGEVMGAALKKGDKQASESDRSIVKGALTEKGYMSTDTDGLKPADAAIVLTGGQSGDPEHGNYGTSFVADFSAALDSRVGGAVLAGDHGSGERAGAIGTIRNDGKLKAEVSTVDNVDRESGAVSAIKAVKEQLEGGVGHYGSAANATDPAPL